MNDEPSPSTTQSRFRAVLGVVVRGALGCVAVGLSIHVVAYLIPPPYSLHPIDRANDIANKERWFRRDVGFIVPGTVIVGAPAGFASVYLRQPRPFIRCLAWVTFGAAVARIATYPGPKIPEDWPYIHSDALTALGALLGCAWAVYLGNADPSAPRESLD